MVTRDEVRRIADLARLALTDADLSKFTEQLNSILDHVEELDAAPGTGDGEPGDDWLVAAGPAKERQDSEGADPLQRSPRELAPAWREGFFTVPLLEAMAATSGGDEGGPGAGDTGASDDRDDQADSSAAGTS